MHGRWGSEAVLLYVRLAPLAGNLALEAALKKDLGAVQAALADAKQNLASRMLQAGAASGARAVMSEELSASTTEALGALDPRPGQPMLAPAARDLLRGSVAAQIRTARKPALGEALAVYPEGKAHALECPRQHTAGLREELQDACLTSTWCGIGFLVDDQVDLLPFTRQMERPLCGRCFAPRRRLGVASDSSSSSSSATSDRSH